QLLPGLVVSDDDDLPARVVVDQVDVAEQSDAARRRREVLRPVVPSDARPVPESLRLRAVEVTLPGDLDAERLLIAELLGVLLLPPREGVPERDAQVGDSELPLPQLGDGRRL